MATRSTDLRPESVPAVKAGGNWDNRYNRTRYSWRPTQSQLDAIAPHRFRDEDFASFINRILRRLVLQLQPVESVGIPSLQFSTDTTKLKAVSFRADAAVAEFVEYQKQNRGNSIQHTLSWLLQEVATLEPVKEIKTQAIALGIIKRFMKRKERELLVELMEELKQHCTEERAKEFLELLYSSGAITLITSEKSGQVGLPNLKGHYKYIQLKPLK